MDHSHSHSAKISGNENGGRNIEEMKLDWKAEKKYYPGNKYIDTRSQE